MPRPLRIHVPGGFYHVTLRGNHQRRIFVDEGDQRLLNTIASRAISASGAKLHAYCWMSNHVHLLIEVDQEALSHPMRNIAAQFARAMQKKLETTGHFFERRYHASLVGNDVYFKELVRYIHLNPVRAGLVKTPEDHPWSSHHVYIGARHEPWVTTDFALRLFGSSRPRALAAYRYFLGEPEGRSWQPGDAVQPALTSELAMTPAFLAAAPFQPRTRLTLADLIAEACARFETTPEALGSDARDRYLTVVRAWIAHQAVKRRICSLSEVARRLHRTEATLREAIRRHPLEVE